MAKTKKGKGLWLKLLIAVAVIAAVGVVVVGSQGEWFQGMLRGVSVSDTTKTVERIDVVKELDTTTRDISGDIDFEKDLEPEEDIEIAPIKPIEVQMAPIPPKAYFGYRDNTGGGAIEQYLYQQVEPPQAQDVLVNFYIWNDGGDYIELNQVKVNTGAATFTNCSPGIGSKFDRCNVSDFSIARTGTLYRLNKNPNGTVNNLTLIANDNNNDGYYKVADNEFVNPEWTRVGAGEIKDFVIIRDTRFVNDFDADHFKGKAFIVTNELILKDSQDNTLSAITDPATVTPQDIRFR